MGMAVGIGIMLVIVSLVEIAAIVNIVRKNAPA